MAKTTSDTPGTADPVEPATDAAAKADARRDDPDNLRDGVTRFEGTISKINKDGETVLSDHIGPGEKRAGDE